MKYFSTVCLLLGSLTGYCQSQLIDCRDNQSYNVVDIDGTLWMVENLIYESKLSTLISEEQKARQPNLSGRFYHVNEIDSICPCDWRLPDAEDWIDYLNYLSNIADQQTKLSFDKDHVAFHKYEDYINIFSDNSNENPLQLIPTGRWEGGQYYLPDAFADYWTHDPPDFGEGDRNTRAGLVHVLPEVYEGRTHIHLRERGITSIHSHKHHLDPNKEKKLRKFMVRCVKQKD